MAKSNSMGFV